jgi:hypothetical protein
MRTTVVAVEGKLEGDTIVSVEERIPVEVS